jgi:hypothetical protein
LPLPYASWAKTWQLSININKCALLSLSTKPQPTLRNYLIDGLLISQQDSYVDLGIAISKNLSFDAHISDIVSNSRQRVSILFRVFLSRNTSTIRQAFITDIRPILDALPGVLRSSPSLPAFKRGLKHIDLSSFLKGSAI